MGKGNCSFQEQEIARSQMDYWKKDRDIDHVFASELAFSLIYNNIKVQYQKQALATMGLSTLPEVMLLVQVDDYLSKYSEINITQNFSIKARVRNCLQSVIDQSQYAGFAANLVGLDTLICFLCLPNGKITDSTEQDLYEFAVDLQRLVRQYTNVSITVCISSYCNDLSDYTSAYYKAKKVLYNSFYTGKNSSVVSGKTDDMDKRSNYYSGLMNDYPAICTTISNGNSEMFREILWDICNTIYKEMVPPKQLKNDFAGLIYTMEVYANNCGLEHSNRKINQITIKYVERVQQSGYLEDIIQYMTEYHSFLSNELKSVPDRDQGQAFREPILEYVRNHYSRVISLADVADITGYSTYHFTRIFRKYFGCTLTEYLIHYRIEQSKEMLIREKISIGEIAIKCGFDNSSYFAYCFRRRVGVPPSVYRKQYSNR